MRTSIAKFGNFLFNHWPAAYQPLYSFYKALADKEERRWLRSALQPGMSVVDVGANIGVYSAFFADLVGPRGAVYAFEPEPRNFTFLENTCGRLPCIRPIKAAVGEHSGMLNLYLSKDLNVDHRTYDDGEGRFATEVPVVRLDEYFSAETKFDLIKLDIQGFELQALRGARRILLENKTIKLLIEYWPYGLKGAGTDPLALLQFLEDLGFNIAAPNGYDQKELLKLGDSIETYTNIFASR